MPAGGASNTYEIHKNCDRACVLMMAEQIALLCLTFGLIQQWLCCVLCLSICICVWCRETLLVQQWGGRRRLWRQLRKRRGERTSGWLTISSSTPSPPSSQSPPSTPSPLSPSWPALSSCFTYAGFAYHLLYLLPVGKTVRLHHHHQMFSHFQDILYTTRNLGKARK